MRDPDLDRVVTRDALAELGRREINSVLLEGGATLAASFLAAGEIDELRLFVAPVLLGGSGRHSERRLEGRGSGRRAASPLEVPAKIDEKRDPGRDGRLEQFGVTYW